MCKQMGRVLEESIRKIECGQAAEEAICEFLETYYDDYIKVREETCERFDQLELVLPLEERESGVVHGLKRLLDEGHDPNEGEIFNPLMMAVGWSDAPMTKYLIEHGADANYWPGMDEEPEFMRDNYYLEDIDVAFLHGEYNHDKSNVDALLQTAIVLMRDGKTGGFSGFCLVADPEKREVSVEPAKYKY